MEKDLYKFLDFIGGDNVVLVRSREDFAAFVDMLRNHKCEDLLKGGTTYEKWKAIFEANDMYPGTMLFECRNRSISIYDDIAQARNWYGTEPIELDHVAAVDRVEEKETKNCRHFAVAIDGPAGAGKTTTSKAVAEAMDLMYVDTGALYRAIGLYVLRACVDQKDAGTIEKMLPDIRVSLTRDEDGNQHTLLNDEDVTGLIRTPEVSMYASSVSAIPAVREKLLDMQRDIAANHDVIMEGRDIGTVVLPNADVKIFLTASSYTRAIRRFKEMKEAGKAVRMPDVYRDLMKRDGQDQSRDTAPLKQADDAYFLNSDNLSFGETVSAIMDIIRCVQETQY